MTKHVVNTPGMGRQPWLDIVSYGRRGHRRPERFSSAQVRHIALIVRRAPEVMVKVSGGGQSIGAVAAHAKYIGCHGKPMRLVFVGLRADPANTRRTHS